VALKANITIDQGTDFSTTIDVTDEDGNSIDLSGYTGTSQMRKHYTSSNATAFSVAVTVLTGAVTISMNAATTGTLTSGRYVYDVELRDAANTVSRLVEGIVTVSPQVTR
jgi:hypothetical protein